MERSQKHQGKKQQSKAHFVQVIINAWSAIAMAIV